MSHPKDKRERFLVGKNLGEKRVSGYFGRAAGFRSEKERIEFIEKNAQMRRDTTKLCSCFLCTNFSYKKYMLTKRLNTWKILKEEDLED